MCDKMHKQRNSPAGAVPPTAPRSWSPDIGPAPSIGGRLLGGADRRNGLTGLRRGPWACPVPGAVRPGRAGGHAQLLRPDPGGHVQSLARRVDILGLCPVLAASGGHVPSCPPGRPPATAAPARVIAAASLATITPAKLFGIVAQVLVDGTDDGVHRCRAAPGQNGRDDLALAGLGIQPALSDHHRAAAGEVAVEVQQVQHVVRAGDQRGPVAWPTCRRKIRRRPRSGPRCAGRGRARGETPGPAARAGR